MYIILVYDVGEERVGKVCKYMRRYLPRVQNSVFEGDLTAAKLEVMKTGLKDILVADKDSVMLWVLRDSKFVDKQIIGNEKLPVTQFF